MPVSAACSPSIEVAAAAGVCAGICGAALERGRALAARHCRRRGRGSNMRCRSLGIIDLLAFLPSAIALIIGDTTALVLFGMLPFLKLVRYSPAMRSLLSALHAERRTLFGCLVILSRRGVVVRLAALRHRAQRPAGQVRHHSAGDVVGDRHPRHRRLWRRGAGNAARQDGLGVRHRRSALR